MEVLTTEGPMAVEAGKLLKKARELLRELRMSGEKR
jgi:hypothetical protein